jgi:4-amino-4-deoxy-L-arabinose transferase-like glycosyltransferase
VTKDGMRAQLKTPALRRLLIVALTLAAFGLRLVALEGVPPGWRDDELINIYALSGEVLQGHYPLYFTGASGHEPLYHYLQAVLNGLAGYNVLSGHLLSVFLGTLTIPLTFVLVRRLFGVLTAALTSLVLAVSFWSLMYSRIGLRHVNLIPFVLAALFLMWVPLTKRRARQRPVWRWSIPLGLTLGASLYIYPAARLLPGLLVLFGGYLALFHRKRFHDVWAGYGLALVVTVLTAAPLALAIARGSNAAAAQGIGADARLVELARPIRALREGDSGPLLENVWTTLGMFHATGDPEWLYNISGRPVFNLLGGVLLWAGVALCVVRWREPRHFFVLLWLGFGLLPTFLSIPPASLSHSIMMQPLAYLLPLLFLTQLRTGLLVRASRAKWRNVVSLGVRYAVPGLMLLFVLSTAVRDLRDYFSRWPQADMVRFLYRADYRQAAGYLDRHPEVVDAAVGSTLLGPWDRLALQDDLRRDDVRVRLFNPEWALLLPATGATVGTQPGGPEILVTRFPALHPSFNVLLDGAPDWAAQGLRRYEVSGEFFGTPKASSNLAVFDNGLALTEGIWPAQAPQPGQTADLWLIWQVVEPLKLPPMPIVANPPPAGVYSGPRLAVFAHLLDVTGNSVAGADGLWVDPTTLVAGDRFLQIHRFVLPGDASSGPYRLEVGLYDPLTNQRWFVVDAAGQPVADHVILDLQPKSSQDPGGFVRAEAAYVP